MHRGIEFQIFITNPKNGMATRSIQKLKQS